MSNDDAINILSDNWGTAFTADDMPKIRRKAAVEARSTLLAEVLAVVDGLSDEAQHDRRLGSRDREAILYLLKGLRTRLAALNQTEDDDG